MHLGLGSVSRIPKAETATTLLCLCHLHSELGDGDGGGPCRGGASDASSRPACACSVQLHRRLMQLNRGSHCACLSVWGKGRRSWHQQGPCCEPGGRACSRRSLMNSSKVQFTLRPTEDWGRPGGEQLEGRGKLVILNLMSPILFAFLLNRIQAFLM